MSKFIVVKLTGWKLVYADRSFSFASAVTPKCKGLASSCKMVSGLNLHRENPFSKSLRCFENTYTHTQTPALWQKPDFDEENGNIKGREEVLQLSA